MGSSFIHREHTKGRPEGRPGGSTTYGAFALSVVRSNVTTVSGTGQLGSPLSHHCELFWSGIRRARLRAPRNALCSHRRSVNQLSLEVCHASTLIAAGMCLLDFGLRPIRSDSLCATHRYGLRATLVAGSQQVPDEGGK